MLWRWLHCHTNIAASDHFTLIFEGQKQIELETSLNGRVQRAHDRWLIHVIPIRGEIDRIFLFSVHLAKIRNTHSHPLSSQINSSTRRTSQIVGA